MSAAKPPILEPTLVFPLEAAPGFSGGWIHHPGLMFAGSPPKLYIAEPAWNATWGSWFAWHAPTIGASVFLATAMATGWWIRRVGKRPRRAGEMYCRICNHQLTVPQIVLNEEKQGIWASRESKCPECGVRHRRGPVRGRSRAIRLLPARLLSTVVLVACGLLMWQTLRFDEPGGWGTGTWPVVGMEKYFGSWALERRITTMDTRSTRLWELDPGTGTSREIGVVQASNTLEGFVSPNGHYAVFAVDDPEGVDVFDLRSGKRSVVSVESGRSKGKLVVQSIGVFSRDGTAVFVRRRTNAEPGVNDQLWRLELATGKFELVASVVVPHGSRASGTSEMTRFVFRELPTGVAWIHETNVHGPNGRGGESTIRWESAGEKMERREKAGSGGLGLILSEDGRACIFPPYADSAARAIDLLSGEEFVCKEPVDYRAAINEAGPRGIFSAGSGMATVESQKGARPVIAILEVSPLGSRVGGSSDGRFAFGWRERDVAPSWIGAMLGVQPTKAPEVRVWDFEKLLDPETELPFVGAAQKRTIP